MHNIPDDCRGMVCPWEEEEWRCPHCGGHQDDVKCHPGQGMVAEYCEQEDEE